MSTESIWEDLRRDLPWKKEDVRKIINPFAEDTSDNLFKAIHCTSDLSIATEPGKTSENLNQLGEDDYHEKTMENLLEEFLSPDRERVLTAIIGGVGCGKSHLVHWMRLFITDPKYVLINVKKSGTSLREIVRQIIEKLPQDKQQDFLSEFNNTGDLLASRENQIRELLNQIALAIKEDKGKDTPEQVELRNAKSTDEKEWEDVLIESLPDLFQDVEYGKRSFSKEDGVIAKIADHIFSPSSPEDRPEALAKFCEDDFPTDNSVYMSAAESARAAIDNIKGAVNENNKQIGPDYATNIVNRNLEFAIARCLKFSADRLEQLMRELRLYLKTQQKELVILIEEFAKLQGIDRALLNSLVAETQEEHCPMRAAIALTTGVFEEIQDTCYTRTTFLVNMDDVNSRMSNVKFVAKYLNALKLGSEKINEWGSKALPGEDPPSACDSLKDDQRKLTFSAFGSVDQKYGLFPFTEKSINNLIERLSSKVEVTSRRIMLNILQPVLLNNYDQISMGQFPSEEFVKSQGKKKIDTLLETDLRNKQPANAEKIINFLEIYHGEKELINLDNELRKAFKVPEINDIELKVKPRVEVNGGDTPPEDKKPPVKDKIPEQEDDFDAPLNHWGSGGQLAQKTTTQCRVALFNAISWAVDWDLIGYQKSAFSGANRSFSQTNIVFDNQHIENINENVDVLLKIPGDSGIPLAKAVTAIRGLLKANKNNGHWNKFKDGDKMQKAFVECLKIWVKSVEDQLIQLCEPSNNWNRGQGAVELLVLGSVLGGHFEKDYPMSVINLERWNVESTNVLSNSLKQILKFIYSERSAISDTVEAQCYSLKGGSSGTFMMPSKISNAIDDFLKRNLVTSLDPPGDDISKAVETYQKVTRDLDKAMKEERQERLNWLKNVKDQFGDATRDEIVKKVGQFLQKIIISGISVKTKIKNLEELISKFKTSRFDELKKKTEELKQEKVEAKSLISIYREKLDPILYSIELIQILSDFLHDIDTALDMQEIGSQTKTDLDKDLKDIEDSFVSIKSNLAKIVGSEA